jgi:hypothetical protein
MHALSLRIAPALHRMPVQLMDAHRELQQHPRGQSRHSSIDTVNVDCGASTVGDDADLTVAAVHQHMPSESGSSVLPAASAADEKVPPVPHTSGTATSDASEPVSMLTQHKGLQRDHGIIARVQVRATLDQAS